MERRSFLKLSGLGAGALMIGSCSDAHGKKSEIPIEVISDSSVGHIMRKAHTYPEVDAGTIDIAIIGGGIAGLTAFQQLQEYDAHIFELSHQWGGTSSAHHHKNLRFAQGAHYELAYPNYFGKKVPELLEALNVMEQNPYTNFWTFKEKEYTILKHQKSRCWIDGEVFSEPLGKAQQKEKFYDIIKKYYDKLPMPTTQIKEKYRALDFKTFSEFLDEHQLTDQSLRRGIDYQMFDDYGGSADQVSALAGLHYYACRPYGDENIELFSPPEGNYYFAQRLIADSEVDNMHLKHLVTQVTQEKKGFKIKIVDVENQQTKVFHARSVVMAGKKHTLPYLFPFLKTDFRAQYSPWISMNIIMPRSFYLGPAIWQNDVMGRDDDFLGYINSRAQHKDTNHLQTFTCYYCWGAEKRPELLKWEQNPENIVQSTVDILSDITEHPQLPEHIIKASLKMMGHAMAIPEPGFLHRDINKDAPEKLLFAGADNGRLPLLYEAMDSGIKAAEKIKKTL